MTETVENPSNQDLLKIETKIPYLRKKLLQWYQKEGRNYPWRTAKDPYKILIAEIMLRRTRADQVLPVYENFVKRYPTVESLSKGNRGIIQKLTYSLGLNWRNQRFRDLARCIISMYQGEIPKSRDELKKLPGVGEYVAGVFLSSAFNRKEWIVDTNVVRVFSRFFGIRIKGDGRRDKKITSIAERFVDCDNPRQVNFAIIDFAALLCKKINPRHLQCFVRQECAYYETHE